MHLKEFLRRKESLRAVPGRVDDLLGHLHLLHAGRASDRVPAQQVNTLFLLNLFLPHIPGNQK